MTRGSGMQRPIRVIVGMVAGVLAAGLVLGACAKSGDPTAAATGPTTSATGPGAGTATTGTGGTGAGTGAGTTVPAKATGAAKPSAGCTTPGPMAVTPGAAADLTIDVDGTTHPYRAFVPAGLEPGKPVPLVLDLHGLTETRQEQAAVSGWETLAARERIIVLTPQGGGAVPNWSATPTPGNPDTEYLRTLIDTAANDLCVDTTRVYAGGISNGGLESSILACRLSDRIAAVGLVAGIVVPEGCTDSPSVPAIVFWGKRDCVLPFYGGLGPCLIGDRNGTVPSSKPAGDAEVPAVEDKVAAWAARNGCAPQPQVTRVGTHTEKLTYTGCTDGDAVELYVVDNGGHTWPGSKLAMVADKDPDAKNGITTDEIDATELMWEFYQRFQNPS